jgi:hypothetical protein
MDCKIKPAGTSIIATAPSQICFSKPETYASTCQYHRSAVFSIFYRENTEVLRWEGFEPTAKAVNHTMVSRPFLR